MQIYSSGQIWKTPPFQDYGLMATVKDSVSFLVTETVHPGIMPLVHFFCIWRNGAWFTYLEAPSKVQSQQNSAGQLQCHTWTFMFAVEASLHCLAGRSSVLRNRNLSPTEVTISCSPTKEPAIFTPPPKASSLWFCPSFRTHKALSSLGCGWH